jgi:hypothetical protein
MGIFAALFQGDVDHRPEWLEEVASQVDELCGLAS